MAGVAWIWLNFDYLISAMPSDVVMRRGCANQFIDAGFDQF